MVGGGCSRIRFSRSEVSTQQLRNTGYGLWAMGYGKAAVIFWGFGGGSLELGRTR